MEKDTVTSTKKYIKKLEEALLGITYKTRDGEFISSRVEDYDYLKDYPILGEVYDKYCKEYSM